MVRGIERRKVFRSDTDISMGHPIIPLSREKIAFKEK